MDVHKERYEIYSAAKSLVETIGAQHDLEKINPAIIRAFYVKMDEARFFFDGDTRAFLDGLHDQCEKIFLAHGKMRGAQNDDARRAEWGDALAAEEAKLGRMYAELPSRFESALALQKLTKNIP